MYILINNNIINIVCKICLFRKFNERTTKEACCPTCNVSLGINPLSKVAADCNTQEILDRLLPQFAKQEEKEKKAFSKLLKARNITDSQLKDVALNSKGISDLKKR